MSDGTTSARVETPLTGAATAGAPEIVVTREMREAGAAVIERWQGILDSVFLAGEVYSAMAGLTTREPHQGRS
jgi:hypothetical protein